LAEAGNLTLDDGTSFGYTYDPTSSSNVYNIQLFTQGDEYRFTDGGPLTTDFQKFVEFYGKLQGLWLGPVDVPVKNGTNEKTLMLPTCTIFFVRLGNVR
jgi:hypothetical protein